jgi:hypothetical protein
MNRHQNKERLEAFVDRFLDDGASVWARWTYVDPVDIDYACLCLMFLHIIYRDDDNAYYIRMPGLVRPSGKFSEVTFSNVFLRADDPVTKRKRLVAGSTADTIKVGGRSDGTTVQRLEAIFPDRTPVRSKDGTLPTPKLFLAVDSMDDAKPKYSRELVSILDKCPSYDREGELVDNYYDCFQEAFPRLSTGSWLLPWSMVTGFGGVMADMRGMDTHFAINTDVRHLQTSPDSDIRISISQNGLWFKDKGDRRCA